MAKTRYFWHKKIPGKGKIWQLLHGMSLILILHTSSKHVRFSWQFKSISYFIQSLQMVKDNHIMLLLSKSSFTSLPPRCNTTQGTQAQVRAQTIRYRHQIDKSVKYRRHNCNTHPQPSFWGTLGGATCTSPGERLISEPPHESVRHHTGVKYGSRFWDDRSMWAQPMSPPAQCFTSHPTTSVTTSESLIVNNQELMPVEQHIYLVTSARLV